METNDEKKARVTFDEQPEKWRLLKSKSHEQPFYFDGKQYVSLDGLIRIDRIRSDGDYFVIPTFVQPKSERLTNKYETGNGWLTPEPEAAGQEQETSEEFLKKMKPQVATFDKHDKVAKLFDYYDITGFAVQYASQQTASLQKQVEELREENERLKKQQGIVAKDFFYWWFNTPGTNTEQGYESYLKTDRYKALNPQDNQK